MHTQDKLLKDCFILYYEEYQNIKNLSELKDKINNRINEIKYYQKKDILLNKSGLSKEEYLDRLQPYKESIGFHRAQLRLIQFIESERINN